MHKKLAALCVCVRELCVCVHLLIRPFVVDNVESAPITNDTVGHNVCML